METITEEENDFQVHSVIHDDLNHLSDNDEDSFETDDAESLEQNQDQTPTPSPHSDSRRVSEPDQNEVIAKEPPEEISRVITAEKAQNEVEIPSSSTEVEIAVPSAEHVVDVVKSEKRVEIPDRGTIETTVEEDERVLVATKNDREETERKLKLKKNSVPATHPESGPKKPESTGSEETRVEIAIANRHEESTNTSSFTIGIAVIEKPSPPETSPEKSPSRLMSLPSGERSTRPRSNSYATVKQESSQQEIPHLQTNLNGAAASGDLFEKVKVKSALTPMLVQNNYVFRALTVYII